MRQPQYYMHPSESPFETLAAEEALLESQRGGIFLLLYRHQPSVIIGRTQNAWAECRTDLLTAEGIPLARRISGGGAVYHDSQNVNFSFIASPDIYDVERQLKVILRAVRSLGIRAEFSGRNDILAEGRKFSGNAFCVRREGAFHHGTLLVDTDGEKMTRYLSVSPDKIAAKGVVSVRSRVVNLKELSPGLTADQVISALLASFAAEYGEAEPWEPEEAVSARAAKLAVRNRSWDWIYGSAPPFDVTAATRFAWGSLEFRFELRRGRVAAAQVFSDAMDPELILCLPDLLQGQPFESAALSAALSPLAGSAQVRDVQQFLLDQAY